MLLSLRSKNRKIYKYKNYLSFMTIELADIAAKADKKDERINFDLLSGIYQGNGHSVLINPPKDEELLDFLLKVRPFYLSMRDSGDSRLPTAVMAQYVHDNVLYSNQKADRTHFEYRMKGEIPPLGKFIQGAECREKSLITHLALAQLGYPSEVVGGWVRTPKASGAHKWVESSITDEVVDPTLGVTMPKDVYYDKFHVDLCYLGNKPPKVYVRPPNNIWGWAISRSSFEFRR